LRAGVFTYCNTVDTYAGQLEDVRVDGPVAFPFVGVFSDAEALEPGEETV
jgi:hypothetical protein